MAAHSDQRSTTNDQRLVYLIAGEPSGDLLGARLMASLKKFAPSVRFAGIGGPQMAEQGLQSLFPYHDLSLMGFSEIVPHIPRLLRQVKSAFEDIRSRRPDAVVTIDSPGFNFRLTERLLDEPSLQGTKRIHYVAPSVWAYKPKRAQRAARLFHHLLLLLPFEPPYFDKVGLPNTYVGHPILWESAPSDRGQAFRRRHGLPPDAPILCLLPGSRRGEVQRLMPVYEQTLAMLQKKYPTLQAVAVAGSQVMELISSRVHASNLPILVVGEEEKKEAFAASHVALSKSGTVTLELAKQGVPMVVTYKVSAYSAWLVRRMIKIPYYSLLNIIENEEIIPEMMQEECRPDLLARKLGELMEDSETRRRQLERIKEALVKLGGSRPESPSDIAAKTVLEMIG